MSIRYQLRGHEVLATEQCLWCDEILRGLGKTQEQARTRLANACEKHMCQAKRERNVRRQVTA
jgi:hypothetical protein